MIVRKSSLNSGGKMKNTVFRAWSTHSTAESGTSFRNIAVQALSEQELKSHPDVTLPLMGLRCIYSNHVKALNPSAWAGPIPHDRDFMVASFSLYEELRKKIPSHPLIRTEVLDANNFFKVQEDEFTYYVPESLDMIRARPTETQPQEEMDVSQMGEMFNQKATVKVTVENPIFAHLYPFLDAVRQPPPTAPTRDIVSLFHTSRSYQPLVEALKTLKDAHTTYSDINRGTPYPPEKLAHIAQQALVTVSRIYELIIPVFEPEEVDQKNGGMVCTDDVDDGDVVWEWLQDLEVGQQMKGSGGLAGWALVALEAADKAGVVTPMFEHLEKLKEYLERMIDTEDISQKETISKYRMKGGWWDNVA
ncbi:hypothetical protein EJ08DRAFT_337893 [Tothia fuscella]|uniref:Uncharacterized protein n=1 Tax=Tothia fuscella TaxID=1048955 RepID=A0A9P4P1A3_9PEZI|nr:hypothetical protein EJ08DRAFT_337893 [Tothia fuscella]